MKVEQLTMLEPLGCKACTHCKKMKSQEEFALNRSAADGLQDWCKSCNKERYIKDREKHLERGKKYYQENKERVLARTKIWWQKHPKQQRLKNANYREKHLGQWRRAAKDNYFRRKYGIDLETYEGFVLGLEGRCCICNEIPNGKMDKDKHLHIDHDHKNGTVRGLLCNTCNRALGLFREDAAVLRAAIWYLELDRTDWPQSVKGGINGVRRRLPVGATTKGTES